MAIGVMGNRAKKVVANFVVKMAKEVDVDKIAVGVENIAFVVGAGFELSGVGTVGFFWYGNRIPDPWRFFVGCCLAFFWVKGCGFVG